MTATGAMLGSIWKRHRWLRWVLLGVAILVAIEIVQMGRAFVRGFQRAAEVEEVEAKWKAYVTAPLPPPPPVLTEGHPLEPLQAFRDCEYCPVMVVIPPGVLSVSRNRDPYEEPRVEITVAGPYAIGKYEVTTGEYRACVLGGACLPPFKGKVPWMEDTVDYPDDWPIRYIDRRRMDQYVEWLSRKTGQAYRIPSEAQWLWAARGGARTQFWWGPEVSENLPECVRCAGGPVPWWSDRDVGLNVFDLRWVGPVGLYEANGYGLHDTMRGALESVGQCASYLITELPPDGSEYSEPDCREVTKFGPSSIHYATPFWIEKQAKYGFMISKYFGRSRSHRGHQGETLGFRVVRVIEGPEAADD